MKRNLRLLFCQLLQNPHTPCPPLRSPSIMSVSNFSFHISSGENLARMLSPMQGQTSLVINQARFQNWIQLRGGHPVSSPSSRSCLDLKRGFASHPVLPQVAGKRELLQESAICETISGNTSGGERQAVRKKRPGAWADRHVCPGCGITMQDKDPQLPGYFKEPAAKTRAAMAVDGEEDESVVDDEGKYEGDEDEEWEEVGDDAVDEKGTVVVAENREGKSKKGKGESSDFQTFYLDGSFEIEDEVEEGARRKDEAIGYEPVGLGYGGGDDEDDDGGEALSKWNKLWESGPGKRLEGNSGPEEKLVVCARCHALRNYGKVKDELAEYLLPDFDFDRVVGARMRSAYGRRSVMLMLVDAADFDGSFPRQAAEILADASSAVTKWETDGQLGNIPRLLVVINKSDLLPPSVSMVRLEAWVRRRIRAGGAPRVSGVHFVSAHTRFGLMDLVNKVMSLAGPRGDVWVIGAQNAGKSSLINAFSRVLGKPPRLTESSLPGTTIGLITVDGIFPNRTRLLDTPGILHPHQLTTRLTTEEQKLALPRKRLRPRTFRIMVGSAIHVGGLARVDVVSAPSESIYFTVWASSLLPCHMGRAEAAGELLQKHIGNRLVPPIGGEERVRQLGRWLPRTVQVAGTRWDQSSTDVAIAGLGWIGVGLLGKCTLRVWTYEGVAVTTREAMVLDMAKIFEKPGFSLGKDVPGALLVAAKPESEETKKRKAEKKSRRHVAT